MRKFSTSSKSLASLGLGAALGLLTMGAGSCGSTPPPDTTNPTDPTDPTDPTTPVVVNNPTMAFDHDGILAPVRDVFTDGEQIPVEQSQRMHACGKVTYPTLQRILAKRGVTLSAGTQCSDSGGSFDCTAGSLFVNGNLVLGIANYPARVPESDRNSTGGIVRLQDILIAAAEALITTGSPNGSFAAGTDCAGASLFNAGTPATCNADGFACYVGVPLTQGQLTLCNQMLADPGQSTDPLVAKRLTLAALSSTIYLCD